MAAWYDLFRPPQPKDEKKVRYHARSVMTGKMSTQHLIGTITRRSTFKDSVVTSVQMALEDVLLDALADWPIRGIFAYLSTSLCRGIME